MKNNMGTIDRITRLILAVIIVALTYQQVITGALAAVLLVVATVFAVTAFIGTCPLYSLVGINTCPAKKQ